MTMMILKQSQGSLQSQTTSCRGTFLWWRMDVLSQWTLHNAHMMECQEAGTAAWRWEILLPPTCGIIGPVFQREHMSTQPLSVTRRVILLSTQIYYLVIESESVGHRGHSDESRASVSRGDNMPGHTVMEWPCKNPRGLHCTGHCLDVAIPRQPSVCRCVSRKTAGEGTCESSMCIVCNRPSPSAPTTLLFDKSFKVFSLYQHDSCVLFIYPWFLPHLLLYRFYWKVGWVETLRAF